MKFLPTEQYLHIERLESKTEETKKDAYFDLPEDYTSEEDKTPYTVVQLLSNLPVEQSDRSKANGKGRLIVVERDMIEPIVFENEKVEIVHKRHLIGFVERD